MHNIYLVPSISQNLERVLCLHFILLAYHCAGGDLQSPEHWVKNANKILRCPCSLSSAFPFFLSPRALTTGGTCSTELVRGFGYCANVQGGRQTVYLLSKYLFSLVSESYSYVPARPELWCCYGRKRAVEQEALFSVHVGVGIAHSAFASLFSLAFYIDYLYKGRRGACMCYSCGLGLPNTKKRAAERMMSILVFAPRSRPLVDCLSTTKRNLPRGEGVGGEARVHQGQMGREVRLLQVQVVGHDLCARLKNLREELRAKHRGKTFI